MEIKPKVGLLSPGDMGHSVGQVLIENGILVYTCLQDRSPRTQALAEKAGFISLPDYNSLVKEVDILLSILVPSQAASCAGQVALALNATGAELHYVDCNAISPKTVQGIAAVIEKAGGKFTDASIIGPPPRRQGVTRFYASGQHVNTFAHLAEFGLDVIVIGDQIGQASAIKMCFASSTKGFTALCLELMTAAQALGVKDALLDEFRISQPALVERIQRSLTSVPAKARRFVGEMEEIAETYADLGLTSSIFDGASDMYQLLGSTPLADRQPEDPNLPDLDQVLNTLVEASRKPEGST